MDSDENLDVLAELNLAIDDVSTATGIPQEKLEELFERAEASIAFSQSLWQLFIDQGMITEDKTPDPYIMEKVIDGLYGEIAAMTLMFSEPAFDMDKYIGGVIALFESTGSAIESKNVGHVPPEVVQGFKSFARRLKNAQAVTSAALAQQKKA